MMGKGYAQMTSMTIKENKGRMLSFVQTRLSRIDIRTSPSQAGFGGQNSYI